MDYIGSKEKVNMWIFSKISRRFSERLKGKIFLDACCGSGSTSKFAANLGLVVVATDVMKFSYHVANGCIGLSRKQILSARKSINKMNGLAGVRGFFFRNYSGSSRRTYLTDANAMKIDAFRKHIKSIKDEKIKSYLIYCMLESLSRVLNTTGVQAAFLKKFKERARNQIELKEEKVTEGIVIAFHKDILDLLKNPSFKNKYKEDILYIDPPYNARQYGPNYHLYETLARGDNPNISGKTGLRDWKKESKSDFCSKITCLNLIKNIIKNSSARYIYISYNSDGLITPEEMKIALKFFGNIYIYEKPQRRYKSDISKKRKYNINPLKEYLFEIIRK